MQWRIGDIVGRKSYNSDIYFKIVGFTPENKALIKGIDVRLLADAPMDDLIKLDLNDVQRYQEKTEKENRHFVSRALKRQQLEKEKNSQRSIIRRDKQDDFFELPGTILHLDGDASYMKKCLNSYRQLNITANGEEVPEERQPQVVQELLQKYRPDILVLTGHDALLKNRGNLKDIDNYRNSKYFAEAVRKAREFSPGLDDLVIFAGACQSYFEALLEAGANYASSPQRVLINIYDPVYVAEKVAQASIQKYVEPKDIISVTTAGAAGIGGMETRGKMRVGMPKPASK